MLLLLEVPLRPQSDEDSIAHDDRHDSGIASGPADMLYGLSLLQFITSEIANKRMSSSVVPVVIIGSDERDPAPEFLQSSPDFWANAGAAAQERELQCVDNGACDAFKSPLTEDKAKTCFMHCYRTRSTKSKLRADRKVSLLGTEEHKVQLDLEDNNYSYLREKMFVFI